MNQSHKSFKGLVMTTPEIKTNRTARRRSGMTMIELLIAISILVIIAAILVPQLRFASADRNIREASRMVASLFAQASQRAVNDGVAGVVIERNPNITDSITNVAYAGTSMFLLRRVPPYTGEEVGDEAEYAQAATAVFTDEAPDNIPDFTPFDPDDEFGLFFDVWIPYPLEQDDLEIVRAGDQISFNNQTFRFNVESATRDTYIVGGPDKLRLRLESNPNSIAGNLPTNLEPNDINDNSRVVIGNFTIHRQPRKLVSSRVDLPAGYLVDLRLSGEIAKDAITYFSVDDRPTGTEAIPNSIGYIYNGRGSIDRFVYGDPAVLGNLLAYRSNAPKQPAYLLVREYNTDENGELIENVLNSERQMWVTVEPVTGAANVISGVPIDLGGADLSKQALQEARQLGSTGQAAQ